MADKKNVGTEAADDASENPVEPTEPAIEESNPRPRRRRWKWFAFPLLLGLLLWFAPAIVARSILRTRILPFLLSFYPGAIDTPAADLDWFAPVVFRNVTFHDLDGEPLLEIAEIETELPLWKVVTHSGDLGTLWIREPRSRIRVRSDGSNLEDVLAAMSFGDAAGERLALAVEIEKATVVVVDSSETETGTLEVAEARFVRPVDVAEPTTLSLAGRLGDGERDGTIKLAGQLDDGSGRVDGWKFEFEADDAPLRAGAPFLERLHPGLDLDALVTARLSATQTPPANEATMSDAGASNRALQIPAGKTGSAEITLTRLDADVPGVLAERLLLERVHFVGQAASGPDGGLNANRWRLETDVGRATFSGSVPVDLAAGDVTTVRRALEILTAHPHELSSTIDIENLVLALPKTTRVRDGLRLDAGTMRFDSTTTERDGRNTWLLRTSVADLAGRVNDTDVRWDQPIRVALDVPVTDSGPRIETVACRSNFLRVDGRRLGRGVDLDVDCDLDRLRRELVRFVNLGDVELAGRVTGTAKLTESLDEHWNANVDLTATRFVLAWPNRRRWAEPKLVLAAKASGRGLLHAVENVDAGEVDITSGEDRLQLKLTRSVAWQADPTSVVWPVAFEGTGALDRWQTRAAPFVSIPDWAVAGAAQLGGRGLFSTQRIVLRECEADVRGFRLQGPGVNVVEPYATVRSDLEWKEEGVVVSPMTTIATRTAAVRAVEFRCDWSQSGPPILSGGVAMRVDLAGVQRWIGRTPAAYGTVTGNAKFRHEAPITKSLWKVNVANLAFDGPIAGDDPNPIGFDGRLDYHHERDILAVRKADVSSNGLAAAVTGRTTKLTSEPNVELTGDIAYDWARLQPRLRPLLGNIVPVGSGRRSFSVKGPVDFSAGIPAELVANAAVDWQAIDALGVPVGPGELVGAVRDGNVAFAPLDVEVSGGRLRTTPRIVSTEVGPVLQLAPGTSLTDARLSPEMTSRWLGLATPLLANSARAEGRLSASLAQASVPLRDWRTMEATGQVTIDTASVQAAPIAGELLGVVQRVRQLAGGALGGLFGSRVNTGIEAAQQTINVRVTRGRVYHDRMLVNVAGVPVTTSGSVGFDETLDLVAELRFPQEMLGNGPLANLVRGPLKVPIRGTTSAPQVDAGVITNLAQRMGVNSLRGEIEKAIPDEIGRTIDQGLNSLFGPLR